MEYDWKVIVHRDADGLEIVRSLEGKITEPGVGDPETAYKIAQAYSMFGDKGSALRVLPTTHPELHLYASQNPGWLSAIGCQLNIEAAGHRSCRFLLLLQPARKNFFGSIRSSE